MRLKAEQERALIAGMLGRAGASASEAQSVAEVTTEADLRGIPSQGLTRFPMLLKRTMSGAIETGTVPEVIEERESIAVVDGRGGYGQHAGIQAMLLAIMKAKETGVGAVTVKDANYVGICGFYAEKAARRDCIGIATSTSDALVHPFGGQEPYVGLNPLAIAFPTLSDPFLFDMATSAMSWGKVIQASRAGVKLPPGVALDASGQPTTDPVQALRGVLGPMAGPRGYGLGVAVAALGALAGGALGTDVAGTFEVDPPANKGDFYLALDLEAFGSVKAFKEKVTVYFQEVRGSAAAPGFNEVLLPGERSLRVRAKNLEVGYEIYDDLWKDLRLLGAQIGYDVASALGSPDRQRVARF